VRRLPVNLPKRLAIDLGIPPRRPVGASWCYDPPMSVVWIFIAVGVFVWLVNVFGTNPSSVAAKGIPARGILLQVQSVLVGKVGTGQSRCEQRKVRIDIEVPGRAPYELDIVAYVPANMVDDVLPGATVALRLGKKDRTYVVIVGPGVGFPASTLSTQGQLNQGTA
jgi:hypothetical protein